MKAIVRNEVDDAVIEGVTQFLFLAKRSKSAEMTISISNDAVPTVSYKVTELPILPKGATDERN